MICSLGDDRVLSYEDTCSFTCNTGYELTGSDTRICQSDGSWSGSNIKCNAGENSLCGVICMFGANSLLLAMLMCQCHYFINFLVWFHTLYVIIDTIVRLLELEHLFQIRFDFILQL